MRLSVIIPTHNRKEILAECLSGYVLQDLKGSFELLVIDDGSTDGTSEAAVKAACPGLTVKYFRQQGKGPAAARNLGIREASGDVLLFTGDDMLPEKNLLSEHAAFHGVHPETCAAMLGLASWDPRIHPSPFAAWLENGGPQFGFGKFSPGEKVEAFWTANISVKRSFLLETGVFDEDFKYPAGEDVELGLRLKKKGLELTYNPAAAVRHFHRVTFSSFCRRQEMAGMALRLLAEKHPGEVQVPPRELPLWKKIISAAAPLLKPLIGLADAAGIRLDPRWYDIVLSYYFTRGRRGAAAPFRSFFY